MTDRSGEHWAELAALTAENRELRQACARKQVLLDDAEAVMRRQITRREEFEAEIERLRGKPVLLTEWQQLTAENESLRARVAELKEALEMVRDADDDCRKDDLPTIPPTARAKIDKARAALNPPAAVGPES